MIRKTIVTITFLFSFFIVGFTQSTPSPLHYSSYADLQSNILNDNDHIIVLNFWATWCKPCVEELPDFDKIQIELKNKHVLVLLANLDFHSKTEPAVPEFMLKKNIYSNVIHITDQDPNDWVGKVDEKWTGSIPATVIYYKGEKKWFFEGKTDYETLKSIITKYISE